jgi:sialate O-acetylesterase
MRTLRMTAIGLLLVALNSVAGAELSLASIFGDHMVLQQGTPNPIWGWADPDALVTIHVSDEAAIEAQADPTGAWEALLKPMAASKQPRTITVTASGETRTLRDVLVGEVWLCSGQSNMQWTTKQCDRFDEVQANADRPELRMFTVRLRSVPESSDDVKGVWQRSSPETVGGFSGTAYHLGRSLQEHLDVPVGLVTSSWGGSTAEAWIGPDALAGVAPGRRVIQQHTAVETERNTNPAMYASPGVDDTAWNSGTVPGHSTVFGIPNDVDGIFWLRIPTDIPPHWKGRSLKASLGKVDDDDVTYFNGFEIGRTNGWQKQRVYEIPGELVESGPATIAIRITDGAGPAGLWGDSDSLFLHPVDAPDDRVSLAGSARMKLTAQVKELSAQHRPSHLYHGMLAPLSRCNFAGVAWYQGESNAIGEGRAEDYSILLPQLIRDWRQLFDDPDMPFLIVQLPNWDHQGGSWNYPRLREAQRRTYAMLPNMGLVITTDIGDSGNIHPRNKHDVGERLARWALVDVYGRDDVIASGPILRTVIWGDDRVLVEFDVFGSSLAIRDTDGRLVNGFEVAGPTGVLMPVEARITSDFEVQLSLPVTARPPTLARYAFKPDPTGDLVNAIGLPAAPFEATR